MNLGDLIKLLSLHKPEAKVVISAPVQLVPGRLMSYRGYYDQLAIEPEAHDKGPTIAEFVETLRGAVGKTFTGYKGGEFTMHEGTAVWLAEYSMSSPWSCRVTGVTNQWDSYARIDWRKDDD